MADSTTRLRVVRVAAAAVFAAGASLTTTGAASALDPNVTVGAPAGEDNGVGAVSASGVTDGGDESRGDGGRDRGRRTTAGVDRGATGDTLEGAVTDDQAGDVGVQGGGGSTTAGAAGGVIEEVAERTVAGADGEEPATAGGPGVDGTTSATGGAGSGEALTCELGESTVICDNTDTDAVGTQPATQAVAKGELARTGAADMAFLLIGAATMIAGGVAFRLVPRMVPRSTAA